VEAAGVEPASENVTGQEPTYLFAFRLPPKRKFRSLRSERDKKRRSLACRSRRCSPDVAAAASPLCDVLSRPVDEARQSGYLQLGSVCHLLIGNYRFAHDYGCTHPGMPLDRNRFRRSRDAPTVAPWNPAVPPGLTCLAAISKICFQFRREPVGSQLIRCGLQ